MSPEVTVDEGPEPATVERPRTTQPVGVGEGREPVAADPTGTALPVVAIGAAACAACCAPPILGAIGITVGLSGLAWITGGLVAAGLVVLGGSMLIVRRRRRAAA